MSKDYNGSNTEVVKRSQINLNPYNPKRHTDAQVKQQVKNIRKNGYLGGIVWNKATGNLIDGHRRVQALDHINKYDGSPEKDYDIKVEVVDFDEKTEKEQMTYMALGNSKADYNLVAQYAPDIDLAAAGVSQEDMDAILSLSASVSESVAATISDFSDMLMAPAPAPVTKLDVAEDSVADIAKRREEQPHETADEVKAKKQRNSEIATERNRQRATYVMLNFANEDDLMAFCEEVGMEFERNLIVDGLQFLRKLRNEQ